MNIQIDTVSKRFGGLQALSKVSFTVEAGSVTAVIGPNGAGKSTLLDCLSGITVMDEGRLQIGDQSRSQIAPHDLVEIGITRTFQNIRLFASLTVLEHVLLARLSLGRTRRAPEDSGFAVARRFSLETLERVGLAEKVDLYPAELSYGERRRLEIARGLATDPRLFLLDEPAAGSTPSEQTRLATLIGEIAAQGVAVVLVEHHIDLVGRVSRSVVVLNFGQVLMIGAIDEVKRNPEVISAYLGVSAA